MCSSDLAIASSAGTLSYSELDQRSAELAKTLQTSGIGPGSLVAICLPRSIGSIVSALAVLRTGAAYLPLDPSNPPNASPPPSPTLRPP